MFAEFYKISAIDRLQGMLTDMFLTPTSELWYMWDSGHERLLYRSSPEQGGLFYEGQYHPRGTCEGMGVCVWCGRTLP